MPKRSDEKGRERFWINGRFVSERRATVPVLDRGLLFGDALYEVVRFYGRRLFLLDEHLDRLFEEASMIDLPVPFDRAALARAIEGLAARGDDENGLVLLQWTRGEGERRLAPPPGFRGNVFALRLPLPKLRPSARRSGVPVITRPDRRWHDARIKSTNLLANVMARRAAEAAGAHEAILYRGRGARARLTEGTSSTIFLVTGKELVTPSIDGLLPGITRGVVLRVAGEAGIAAVERTVRRSELRAASEAFLTATSAEILPVASADGRPFGGGAPGPVTRRLIDAFRRYRQRVLEATPRARLSGRP